MRVHSGGGLRSTGESAKLYGLAAPGSRFLKAFKTLDVVTRIRITAGKFPYASNIRAGRRLPHPRHWEPLAQLVCIDAARSKE